jgi:hypothetical protein
VSFHTFTLSLYRCVRLLLRNLGRRMPQSVVREELEDLDMHVQGVRHLRSSRHDQDPIKDGPLNPNFIVSVRGGPRYVRRDLSPNSAVCECRWSRTWLQRVRCKRY